MWKQILVFLAATQFTLPIYAISASAITPLTPDETVPTGLEDVPPKLTAAVEKISSLPPTVAAASDGSHISLPEIVEMKAGLAEYKANRPTCLTDQTRASMICRSETSPEMQSTALKVNALVSVGNIAMNDNCSAFKKGMTLVNAGLTAYTAACGLVRQKCTMSCTAASDGLRKVFTAAAKISKSMPRCSSGMNVTTCLNAESQLTEAINVIATETSREIDSKNKISLLSKMNLCKQTYGLLLASTGLGLIATVKSLKEGQKCDDETSSSGGGASTAAAASSVGSDSSSSSSSGLTSGTGTSSGTATGTTPPPTPGTESYSSSSDGRVSTVVTVTPPSSTETPSPGASDSMGRVQTKKAELAGGTQATQDQQEAPPNDSELRQYLPGGAKAALATSGTGDSHPDITSSGGKSNFEKMRLRFRELGLQN